MLFHKFKLFKKEKVKMLLINEYERYRDAISAEYAAFGLSEYLPNLLAECHPGVVGHSNYNNEAIREVTASMIDEVSLF